MKVCADVGPRVVLIESFKGAVILALLEQLYVTRPARWFKDHVGACMRVLDACAPDDAQPARAATATRS